MKETKQIIVLITAANEVEAKKIGDELLNQRKAACVNTISKIKSRYWWQGKIESADEDLLIVKTNVDLLPEIVRIVKKLHSYQVPEIIALPVTGGNEDYLKWIEGEIRG